MGITHANFLGTYKRECAGDAGDAGRTCSYTHVVSFRANPGTRVWLGTHTHTLTAYASCIEKEKGHTLAYAYAHRSRMHECASGLTH
jgi:hypothetical protein